MFSFGQKAAHGDRLSSHLKTNTKTEEKTVIETIEVGLCGTNLPAEHFFYDG